MKTDKELAARIERVISRLPDLYIIHSSPYAVKGAYYVG